MKDDSRALESAGVGSYAGLVRAVRRALAEGRARAEKVVDAEKVRTAWEIGKLIDEHVLQHKARADYGVQVLTRLARDLGMSHTELKYMVQFARTYPIGRPAAQLSWSEYETLLAVNEAKQRNALATKAVRENWKRDRLRKEVRKVTQVRKSEKDSQGPEAEAVSAEAPAPESLRAVPGKVGAYRIVRAKAGPYAGELAIDLGFSNYVSLRAIFPACERFNDRDIVLAVEAGGGCRLNLLPNATGEDLFTYPADVYEVIDGDTVNAVIDLGFGFTTAQTLRLRGLDAPEIASSDGGEAKEALEKMLAFSAGRGTEAAAGKRMADRNDKTQGRKTNGVAPVLVRTVKSDKYDRYLVDVFRDDTYINQALVERGFAAVVEE